MRAHYGAVAKRHIFKIHGAGLTNGRRARRENGKGQQSWLKLRFFRESDEERNDRRDKNRKGNQDDEADVRDRTRQGAKQNDRQHKDRGGSANVERCFHLP